jgi:hypothetical protein
MTTKETEQKSITGRDGYIMCKALAYAIETIERLPTRWQEWSDKEDMKALLTHHGERMFGTEYFYQSARHHIDGAAEEARGNVVDFPKK